MGAGLRRGGDDRLMAWLATALLCVLAGHAPARGGVEADREVPVSLSNDQAGMSSTIFVPVILSASGQNNSFFTSELTLTNRGDQEARLDYRYTADRGGGSGMASDRLAPGQQKIAPDALAYLRGLGIPIPRSGNRLGTLRVEVSGSSDLGVSVRTTTLVPEGRAGLAYPGIAGNGGIQEAVYLCGLRQNGQDRSNVAVQNAGRAGEESIALRVTVFSGDPTPAARSMVLPDRILPPGGSHQFDGILKEAGFDNGYVKVERVEGKAPFYAYGVINDQVNSDGSFVFPVTAGSLQAARGQTLPVIVETGTFTSELMLTNFSGIAKTVTLRLKAEAIEAPDRTATIEWTLQPGQQVIVPNVVEEMRQRGTPGIGSSGKILAGALFATVANGDMSGIVIGARTSSSDGRGGQYGVFYTAVPHGAGFTKSVWIDALKQNEDNRSNLALINTGEADNSPSVFQMDIYDGTTGTLANTVTGLKVPARGWRQINAVLGKYAPGSTQGYVRISQISGNNPFVAYGIINDGGAPGQRSGDGAYLPATVTIDAPVTEEMTDREVLETLDLNNNRLSGPIPTQLGKLSQLQWLLLGGNHLSRPIPTELGQLDRLQGVSLQYNQLSGPIPPELGSLSQLQWLNLSANQLNGMIPPELTQLATLRELDLGFNAQLTGPIPPGLEQLNLSTLDLMATSVCVPEDAQLQKWLATVDFTSSGLTCGRPANAVSTIDLLVIYTPEGHRDVGGTAEMEAQIDLMIAETNQMYVESGVNQRLVLVAREEVNYTETGNGGEILVRLKDPSDGYLDEVHAIRDQTGADLVYFVSNSRNVAEVPGAFSVGCGACGARMFAHEIGHNMGLHHDRYADGGHGLFPYSHGYVNQQAFVDGAPESAGWRTIMAYASQCGNLSVSCGGIMRFSNPNQTYLGDPLGVPGDERTTAVNGPADAVRALNLTRHSVSGLRPRVSGNRLTTSATVSKALSMTRTNPAAVSAPRGNLFRAVNPNVRGNASLEASGVLDRATLRRRQINVDVAMLDRAREGGSMALRLNLFDDVVLIGIIEQWTPTYSGGYALAGRLARVPGGTVTLVVNGSVVAGTIRLPGTTYRIRPANAGRHTIIQVDPSLLPRGCETVSRRPDFER